MWRLIVAGQWVSSAYPRVNAHEDGSMRGGTAKTSAMMDAPETIETIKREVSCDGGDDALGHPIVYLKIGPKGWVECGYCDRRFVLAEGADADAAH